MVQEPDHFKHKVHVLFKREDLDHERLEGKVVIVLDVLFATTTIIHALHSGAKEVIPVLDEESARDIATTQDPTTAVVGALYMRKWAFTDEPPDKISVTISEEEK